MSISAAELIALVSVTGAEEAATKLLGLGTSADSAQAALTSLTIGGIAIAGAALIGIGAKSVDMAAKFQESTNMLVTSAGEIRSNLEMVRAGILQMSIDTATSTTELVSGMYMVESAGFHGADGLLVLKAAAEGAKAEQASLASVSNAVTSALTAYSLKGTDATWVTNTLVAAVGAGKMHMQDLATALKNVLPVAATFGISLKDTTAALATMTVQGDDAASAATHLRQFILALEAPTKAGAKALASIGLSSAEVAKEMRISLPDAIAMIMDALKKKFPEGSDAYNQALKSISGGTKQMMAILELSGKHLGTFRSDVDQISKAVKEGGGNILGWTSIQGNFNFKMESAKNAVSAFMIILGTNLLPVLSKVLDAVTPMIAAFTKWTFSGHAVSDVVKFVTDHAQVMVPVLSGVGAIIAGLLVSAFVSLAVAAGGAAVAVISATWPFIAIGVAVAGLVAIFQHFYATNAAFKTFADQMAVALKQVWSAIQANFMPALKQVGDFIHTTVVPAFQKLGDFIQTTVIPAFQKLGGFIQTTVWPILQQIGAWLISTFKPVWQQLSDTFHQQLIPAFSGLIASVKPLMPVFMAVGAIIGGVIAINIGILIGMIKGLVQAFAAIISGVAIAFGGVVKIISGAAQVINGIISFIVDLVTGHFDKLGADLGTIWKGISTMIGGVWDVISGLFRAAIGAIIGFIGGFVSGIIGFFQNLWSTLVGHSIVPDMINGIISWFQQLPGRAIAAVQALTGQIVGFFSDLAAKALTGGQAIITGIINGIQNMMGNLGQKMQDVTKFIGSFLPHSPAERGELSHLNEYGPSLVNAFAKGIVDSTPVLQAAITHLVKPAAALGVGATPGIGPILPPSITTSVAAPQIIVNPPAIYLDGQRLTQAQMPYIANAIRYGTGVFGM